MMKRNLLAFTAFAALAALPAGSASADCKRLAGEARSAIAAAATTRYDDLYAAVGADPTCDANYRGQVGRAMARSLLTTLPVDSDPSAIARALRFGRPWQVLVALGDAYYDRQDFANAGDAYQEALTDMADAAANPTPPQAKMVDRVEQRALQSGSLVPAADMFASRGFATATPHAGPMVIAFFAANSAELGEVGRAGVKAAFAGIQRATPKSLVVIGHTDAGEDAALAEARAQAVAAYLDALGYAGRIETVGRGSDDPFRVDEPDRLPPKQRQKLERRVEYAPGD
jgi:outer membrane protein OmpA-like peptidoglycan-associated protein